MSSANHTPLERFVVDLLEGDWWACNVLGEALLGGLVEDANAVIYAKTGMLPGQEVAGEVFVQEFALYHELDHPTAEYLDHRLEPGERDVEEGTSSSKPPSSTMAWKCGFHRSIVGIVPRYAAVRPLCPRRSGAR